MYADRGNWPSSAQVQMKPFLDERMWAFFRNGIAARNRTGG